MIRSSFLLLFLLIFGSSSTFAQLEAWFDYKVFHDPANGAYVETHINFVAQSLAHKPLSDSTVQANVLTTVIIKQNDEIVDFRKITINGPETTSDNIADFLDIQRFAIAQNGQYSFEIELEDLNDASSPIQHMEQDFAVKNSFDLPFISDITFVKAYAKATEQTELSRSGYDMVPYINNYFPSSFDVLIAYVEVYNTNKIFGDDGKFALVSSITSTDGTVVENLKTIKRKKAQPVMPLMQSFDISTLRTGDYLVNFEVRDKKNELVVRKSIPFFRNKFVENPTEQELALIDVDKTFASQYQERDELREHINSLQPISSNLERITAENQLANADLILMQQYFYHFWARRDTENPEALWREYEQEVIKAEANFGTRIKKGYETDRGRVYLKYGPPNTRVMRHNSQEVFPYEIWHYYDIGTQHDRRFLFYDETAVLEDFELLHSDVQGEVQNHAWKQLMRGRGGASSDRMQQEQLNQHNLNSFDFQELETLFYNPR